MNAASYTAFSEKRILARAELDQFVYIQRTTSFSLLESKHASKQYKPNTHVSAVSNNSVFMFTKLKSPSRVSFVTKLWFPYLL
jgi:hypothetical protein